MSIEKIDTPEARNRIVRLSNLTKFWLDYRNGLNKVVETRKPGNKGRPSKNQLTFQLIDALAYKMLFLYIFDLIDKLKNKEGTTIPDSLLKKEKRLNDIRKSLFSLIITNSIEVQEISPLDDKEMRSIIESLQEVRFEDRRKNNYTEPPHQDEVERLVKFITE